MKIKLWTDKYRFLNAITKENVEFLKDYTEDEFMSIFKDKEIGFSTSFLTINEGVQMLKTKQSTGKWVAPKR